VKSPLRVLNYLKYPLQQQQESIGSWMKRWMLNGGLDAVEALLPGDEFCFGASPTLADCCLIPQLFNANRIKISYAHLPKIPRVEQTCASHTAFDLALPSRQVDAGWR
jgi:maleylpyruvate isomerase